MYQVTIFAIRGERGILGSNTEYSKKIDVNDVPGITHYLQSLLVMLFNIIDVMTPIRQDTPIVGKLTSDFQCCYMSCIVIIKPH